MNADRTIQKYYNRQAPTKRMALYLSGFAVVEGALIVSAVADDRPHYYVWTMLVLVPVIVGIACYKAIANEPTLILDDNGVHDQATFNKCGFIPWTNVAGADVREHLGSRFLCIDLVDDSELLKQSFWVKRGIMKSNRKPLGTICTIPEKLLNEEPELIVWEIRSRLGKTPDAKFL